MPRLCNVDALDQALVSELNTGSFIYLCLFSDSGVTLNFRISREVCTVWNLSEEIGRKGTHFLAG